jgi:hypothetical protein
MCVRNIDIAKKEIQPERGRGRGRQKRGTERQTHTEVRTGLGLT